MTRIPSFALAAAVVVLLAACSGPAAADAPSTPNQAPSPAATPMSTPNGGRPTAAFDGDCGSAFTESEVAALVGTEVTLDTGQTGERGLATEVLGGLRCSWGDDGGPYVWLTLIPAAGLDATIAEHSADQPWCYGGPDLGIEGTCSFSRVAGGYWLAGVFVVAAGSGKLATDGIDELASILEKRATEHPAAPVALPAGMWASMECDALAAGVSEEIPLGALVADRGSMGGEAGPGFYGALEHVGDSACVWSEPGAGGFTTEFLPGAGWAIDDLTDVTSTVVEGAATAVVRHEGDTAVTITATDGVNLAWITAQTEVLSEEEAAAFLAAVMRTAAG
jgi:hypothetical protein